MAPRSSDIRASAAYECTQNGVITAIHGSPKPNSKHSQASADVTLQRIQWPPKLTYAQVVGLSKPASKYPSTEDSFSARALNEWHVQAETTYRIAMQGVTEKYESPRLLPRRQLAIPSHFQIAPLTRLPMVPKLLHYQSFLPLRFRS